MYRHSDIPQDNLRAGSLLIHLDKGGLGQPGDIFHQSKVFMFDFERGKSIKGVVLNK